jgi:hypothetical protein
MSGISQNLEDFRKLSREHYKNLIEGLDEKYCWKCPMRTNSSEAFCREVDSWVRLSNAFEKGVYDHLRDMGIPSNCLEVMASKMLEKKMKSDHITPKFQKMVFLKLEEDMDHGAKSGNFLLIKEYSKNIKNGDRVLLPRACPLSTFWFSKISYINKMPLKIFKVQKVYHKTGVKFIQTEEGIEIPVEFVYGIILRIIDEKDPVYSELGLKNMG